MKHLRLSLALFLFFVGVLSGVRYLDARSAHYVTCVEHIAAQADSPFLYPEDGKAIAEKLDNSEAEFVVKGQPCPAILAAHKDELKARFQAVNAAG
ncbi:MAG: hypothetical protein ACSHXY_05315 [Alphaproteobacteria bacterium]